MHLNPVAPRLTGGRRHWYQGQWRGGNAVRIIHSGGPQRARTALAILTQVLLFLLGLSVLA